MKEKDREVEQKPFKKLFELEDERFPVWFDQIFQPMRDRRKAIFDERAADLRRIFKNKGKETS